MRFMVVGDMHGDAKNAAAVINEAGKRKITHIFQMGDFGLWTHTAEGHDFLDEVNAACKENECTLFAIGGNHEHWDHWNLFVEHMPTHKGFAFVRRRILLAPKVHAFKLANTTFAVAGGAVSIDKDYRRKREQGMDEWGNRVFGAKGPGTLWWPNEELTDSDVALIKATHSTADVLFTHDCSNYTNFHGRLKPDYDSVQHRKRIDAVIAHVKPKFHFHGHMHTRYEWDNTLSHGDSAFLEGEWTGPVTKTFGLECNPSAMHGYGNGDWWGVFDTETQEFAWQGRGR